MPLKSGFNKTREKDLVRYNIKQIIAEKRLKQTGSKENMKFLKRAAKDVREMRLELKNQGFQDYLEKLMPTEAIINMATNYSL